MKRGRQKAEKGNEDSADKPLEKLMEKGRSGTGSPPVGLRDAALDSNPTHSPTHPTPSPTNSPSYKAWAKKKYEIIRKAAKSRGLPTRGPKTEIISRLLAHDKKQSTASADDDGVEDGTEGVDSSATTDCTSSSLNKVPSAPSASSAAVTTVSAKAATPIPPTLVDTTTNPPESTTTSAAMASIHNGSADQVVEDEISRMISHHQFFPLVTGLNPSGRDEDSATVVGQGAEGTEEAKEEEEVKSPDLEQPVSPAFNQYQPYRRRYRLESNSSSGNDESLPFSDGAYEDDDEQASQNGDSFLAKIHSPQPSDYDVPDTRPYQDMRKGSKVQLILATDLSKNIRRESGKKLSCPACLFPIYYFDEGPLSQLVAYRKEPMISGSVNQRAPHKPKPFNARQRMRAENGFSRENDLLEYGGRFTTALKQRIYHFSGECLLERLPFMRLGDVSMSYSTATKLEEVHWSLLSKVLGVDRVMAWDRLTAPDASLPAYSPSDDQNTPNGGYSGASGGQYKTPTPLTPSSRPNQPSLSSSNPKSPYSPSLRRRLLSPQNDNSPSKIPKL